VATLMGHGPLPGSERPRAADTKLIGPLDPNERLSVTLLVRSRPGAPPLPDLAYAHNTQLQRRTHLSVSEFRRIYGADPIDLDAVTHFVRSHGMTILESEPGRCSVIAEGTAAQMRSAFGVDLQRYEARCRAPRPGRADGRSRAGQAVASTTIHHGFDGPVHIPAELIGIVTAVVGLDNRVLGGRNATGDPMGATYLSVPTLAQMYNFPNSGASDQTIGVFSGGGNYLESGVEYSQATVTWTASEHAVSYEVVLIRSDLSSAAPVTLENHPNIETTSFQEALAGQTGIWYQYQIVARNRLGTNASALSNSLTVPFPVGPTPSPGPPPPPHCPIQPAQP
jgi:Pro-kumamolisin, activation domain